MKLTLTAVIAVLLGAATAAPAAESNGLPKRAATSFWYANMDHTGTPRGFAPDLDGGDFNYPVFLAATPGDGASIQRAINAGGQGPRQTQWLASQPRVW